MEPSEDLTEITRHLADAYGGMKRLRVALDAEPGDALAVLARSRVAVWEEQLGTLIEDVSEAGTIFGMIRLRPADG